jgi:hypothetical protein
MAKKETHEDILRTILEKGGMNPKTQAGIGEAVEIGRMLRGSISAPLTSSNLIPAPPVQGEGVGSSKKLETQIAAQKKVLDQVQKNTGNTAKLIDNLIKIQKTYNDDSKILMKSLLESNESQRISNEENNRSKKDSDDKKTAYTTKADKGKAAAAEQDKKSGNLLSDAVSKASDFVSDLFGGSKKTPAGSTSPRGSGAPGAAKTPGMGSRMLRGGLVGGAAMAGYSLLGPDQQQALEEKGVDSEAVGVLGTAAGLGGVPGVFLAAGYALLKLIEKSGKVEREREEKRKAIYDAGKVDVPYENFKYENRTFEQGETPEETERNRQAYEARLDRERMDLKDAPFLTKYYGIDRGKYLESKQDEREQQFFNRRANAGSLRAANEGVTVTEEITPSTENITKQKADEIYGMSRPGNVDFWKNTDQRRRTKLLEDAQKRGVTGINPHPENGAPTATPTSRIEIPTGYETGSAQSRFEKITSEAMATTPQPQAAAPVIINGGSTINNITTASPSGGGGGGGGGTPSRVTNPWDTTIFGRQWEPYY